MAPDPQTQPQTKRQILRKRQEFLAVAAGRRVHAPLLTLQYWARDTGPTDEKTGQSAGIAPRFGLTVTKKTGNSVVRNRIRRRLRAALDQIPCSALPPQDYVIIARQGCLTATFHNLVDALNQALQKSCRPLKPSSTAVHAAPPLPK